MVQIFSSGRCIAGRLLDFTMIRWELHDRHACPSRIAKVPIQGLVIEEQVYLDKKYRFSLSLPRLVGIFTGFGNISEIMETSSQYSRSCP